MSARTLATSVRNMSSRARQLAAYRHSLGTRADLPEAPLPPAEDANAPK